MDKEMNPVVSSTKKNRLLPVVGILLSLLVFLSFAPAVYKWFRGNASTFLSIGSGSCAVISSDSKYVAYAVPTGANEYSILLRQTADDKESTLIKLNPNISCTGLNFNPDNNFLYYTTKKEPDKNGEMFRVSIGGGEATKILSQADSEPRFSPEGKQFVYLLDRSVRKASADGSLDVPLIQTELPDDASADWSPDGKSIIYVSSCPDGVCLAEFSFEDGSRKSIGSPFEEINDLRWLPDKSGLILCAREINRFKSQVYKISYPKGDMFLITSGFDDYLNLSVTADSYYALALRERAQKDLWSVSLSNPGEPGKQITNSGNLFNQVSWSRNGTILAAKESGDNYRIILSDKNGNNFQELVNDKWSAYPLSSSDGNSFFYFSKGGVWRAGINGENQKRIALFLLNKHLLQYGFRIMPDDKWIVGNFNDANDNAALRKINVENNETIALSDKPLTVFAISPNGTQLAYLETDEKNDNRLIIRPFEGGKPTKQFDLPQNVRTDYLRLRWTRDGSGVAYNINDKDYSNIWLQLLSETTPKQLTNFTSQQIYDFDFSPGGNEIVCIRGIINNEIMLMRNFR